VRSPTARSISVVTFPGNPRNSASTSARTSWAQRPAARRLSNPKEMTPAMRDDRWRRTRKKNAFISPAQRRIRSAREPLDEPRAQVRRFVLARRHEISPYLERQPGHGVQHHLEMSKAQEDAEARALGFTAGHREQRCDGPRLHDVDGPLSDAPFDVQRRAAE